VIAYIYRSAVVYKLHTYIYLYTIHDIYICVYYIICVYTTDELGTAVRVTKVSLVNCPEMTIKRSGPVGLWALGDPFGGNVYGSPQAVPVRLLFRRPQQNKAAANKNCEKNLEPTARNPHIVLYHTFRSHAHYTAAIYLSLVPTYIVFQPRYANIDKLSLYCT